MSTLSAEGQALIDRLLDGKDRERREAVDALPNHPDKEDIAAFLTDRLSKEKDGWARAWSVSALAAINATDAASILASRIDLRKEEFKWVRYWAVVGLNKLQPPNLQNHLVKATKDPDPMVKAIALRVLIENGFEDDHVEQLIALMRDSDWYCRWAACKVLRRAAGRQPFREGIENRFIPVLEERLHDNHELMDVRFQAALSFGGLEHKWKEAIEALTRALHGDLSDWARRSCVDALAQIGKPETKEALLLALQDNDAEIRVRAANALKDALGETEAARFIISEELLRQDEPSERYFDALRWISSDVATDVLSDHLRHPDPDVATRASGALAKLGGEAAVRTLQTERTKALQTYTDLLGTADSQVMEQFSRLMGKAHQAFSMSMWMHSIIFGLGVGVLIASIFVALSKGFETFERFVGIGTAAGSLLTLLLLFYKDPIKNIHRSVTDLVEVNVVFLGYVRQINQIDATFKQLFLAKARFGVPDMQQTVEQIQTSVQRTLEEVKGYLKPE